MLSNLINGIGRFWFSMTLSTTTLEDLSLTSISTGIIESGVALEKTTLLHLSILVQAANTMNSQRIVTSLLLRASRASILRVSRCFRAQTAPTIRLAPPLAVPSQFRIYSQAPPPTKPSKIYSFEDVCL